jgi:hypothetical protein
MSLWIALCEGIACALFAWWSNSLDTAESKGAGAIVLILGIAVTQFTIGYYFGTIGRKLHLTVNSLYVSALLWILVWLAGTSPNATLLGWLVVSAVTLVFAAIFGGIGYGLGRLLSRQASH